MMLIGGIELGGTKVRCAQARNPSEIVAQMEVPTGNPQDVAEAVLDFFAPVSLAALGIASFGPLQSTQAGEYVQIAATPKSTWRGVRFADWLAPLQIPLLVNTDVNAAALAEYRSGAAQGAPITAYVTVGTGIGVGLCVEGQFLPQRKHAEMGHIYVNSPAEYQNWLGSCPFHGNCLEGLASGAALKQRWGQAAETLPADHPAWELAADHLAQLCVALLLLLAADRIVLGGGVMQHPGLLADVRRRTAARLDNYHGYSLADIEATLVSPKLAAAGLVGALYLAASLAGA